MDKAKYNRLERSRKIVKKKLEEAMKEVNRHKKRLREIQNQQDALRMADQPKLFD